MFENLSDRLSRTLRNISGRGRLTEENIKETLREVRMALLEATLPCQWFVILLRELKKAQ
ncbi:Signal recognition particle protein [Proteus vulgaris]|nr:Signal recognition particle protein [Proteus vulgaris]